MKSFACLILLVLAALPSVKAQSTTVQEEARRHPRPEEQETIENKALMLLDEVVEDAHTLRLAENRLRLQVSGADLLWPHDERRARALFMEAINNFNEIMRDADYDETEDEGLLQARAESREELLKALARHDPQWAARFLHAHARSLQPDDELELSLKVAAEVASYDPQKASQLAEESLTKGFSYQLPDLVLELQKRAPEDAAKLVSSIVAKLNTVSLATDKEAANIAQQLLLMGTQAHAHDSAGAEPKDRTIINQQAVRELVEMIAAAAVRAPSTNPELLSSLQPLLPEVEKYAPSLAARVRRKLAEAAQTVGEPEGNREGESVEDTTADRSQGQAMGEKRHLSSSEERAAELIEQANSSAAAGKQKLALQLLGEARMLLGNQVRNNAQLHAQLRIAQAYAALDPRQSFEVIEPLAEQLNSVAEAVLAVDGFINEEQLTRDEEFLLGPISDSIRQFLEEDTLKISTLACADFERSRNITSRFQRPEIRALARLLLAQSVLHRSCAQDTR